MDWETLLGFVGVYLMLVGIFIHNFMTQKKFIQMSVTNQKILQVLKNMIAEDIEKRSTE